MRLLRCLAIICITILSISILIFGCAGAHLISPGDKAPNFNLKTPSGEGKSLTDYKGAPVLLIFEQIPCENCDTQRPYIQGVLKASNIKMSVISVYCENSAATVQKDRTQKGLADFGIALVDADGSVPPLYGCGKAYPNNILIDENGIVKAVKIGRFTNQEEVINWLKSYQQGVAK